MSEPEDPSKTDRETHLHETPDQKVRDQLSRLPDPHSSISYGGMVHVTPPSRDAKTKQQTGTGATKSRRLQNILTVLLAGIGIIALLVYRLVADVAYSGLATIEMMQHNVDAAGTHYKDAYLINPTDLNPLTMAASIHLGQGKEQLAQEEFGILLSKSKMPAFIHNQRAKILKGMNRKDDAMADWTEAIRIDPNYFAAHAQRATLYQDKGDYANALPDWDAAAKNNIDPKNSWALANKAYALGRLGRHREALEVTNEGLKITPDDTWLNEQRRFYERQLRH
jgi:tetratricopeptide (TPR) repeat protein